MQVDAATPTHQELESCDAQTQTEPDDTNNHDSESESSESDEILKWCKELDTCTSTETADEESSEG